MLKTEASGTCLTILLNCGGAEFLKVQLKLKETVGSVHIQKTSKAAELKTQTEDRKTKKESHTMVIVANKSNIAKL